MSISNAMVFRKAADAYLKQHNLHRTGGTPLLLRAMALLALLGVTYAAYLLLPSPGVLTATAMGLILGVLLAGVGMMVMHDASHCTFHRNRHINSLFYTLSVHISGISAMVWTRKHVVAHHAHTNILGEDTDLTAAGLLRLHPNAPYKSFFRFQHFYYPLLYPLLVLEWVFTGDLRDILTNTYNMNPPTRRRAIRELITTRIVHFTLLLAVPMVFHGPMVVLTTYLCAVLTVGAILAFVFQPAHVTPKQSFPTVLIPHEDFETHQLHTTADFGTKNRFLTFYLGSLNHQVEHHLFPHIASIHYPKLRPIVQKLAAEHNLPYHSYPSFFSALRAHHRHIVTTSKP